MEQEQTQERPTKKRNRFLEFIVSLGLVLISVACIYIAIKFDLGYVLGGLSLVIGLTGLMGLICVFTKVSAIKFIKKVFSSFSF